MRHWQTFSIHSPFRLCMCLLGLTVLATTLSLCLGPVSISLQDVLSALLGQSGSSTAAHIVLLARLPRTCGCLLAGAALATAGAVIQGVLNNPLAAPNTIGINAGAGLAVAALQIPAVLRN